MRKIVLLALFLFTLTAVFTTTSFAQTNNWRDKVDDWVLETAVPPNTPSAQNKTYPTTQFLVQLQAQADLSGAAARTTKEEKGRYVYEQLTAVADQTQPVVIQQLQELGVAYKPFWVSNMIWVEGDIYAIQTLAMRSDVAHLYANPLVKQEIEPPVARPLGSEAIAALDNIELVGATDVWALGYTGQGVVIGGQDTGYEWTHESLQPSYRGWNGSSADHNYNWHDAWNTAVNACPANSQAPCDDYGHGTHTMGTMAGINDIGMAPDAKWIGCRNMTGGDGTPASYTACYQWFIAPTDLNNANPDPSKAPDVINNSWSCPTSEGCVTPDALAAVVANVRAAGIVTVHSAGNSGSACSTIDTPAAIYDDSFTVGATDASDAIASFSSRGPVTWDGSNRLKPDISAPGVSIYSATLGNGYGLSSGTSMAAPHVAGLVALLISARPYLRGNVDAIEQIIQDTAVPLTTTQNCGSDTPTSVPNNVYGYGRIDALNAITQLIFTEHLYLPLIQKN